jgi:Holliday junction resolvase RusA-like endonuclease
MMNQPGLLEDEAAPVQTKIFDGRQPSSMRFHLNCIPPKTSHHHKKITTIRTKAGGEFRKLVDRPELVAAKGLLEELLIGYRPDVPVLGPYVLTLEFTWPWRKSEKKRTLALGRIPHVSRPDCSNLAKTLEDRLVSLRFIDDDNAVSELRVRKYWGDTPGIVVSMETVTQ